MTKALAQRSLLLIAGIFVATGLVTLRSSEIGMSRPSVQDVSSPQTEVGSTPDFPDVTIETADGARTNFSATAGHVRIATMIYSHCPGVCPMTIDTLRGIDGQLTAQQRERLNFVLLSLDPARDSPESLRALAHERGLASPRWLIGRTSEADARAFATASQIHYRTLSDGSIDHSTALALIDERGRLLARLADGGDSTEFVTAVRQALGGSR
jgi:protein SCO1